MYAFREPLHQAGTKVEQNKKSTRLRVFGHNVKFPFSEYASFYNST